MLDWIEAIKKDLTPFADPGTKIEYDETEKSLSARWKSRRKLAEALFTRVDERNYVLFQGREISYPAFLACSEMSDLLGVAGMILQSHQSSFFIETSGRKQDDVSSISPALSLLQEAAKESSDSFTNVIFVTGDAGAGKTEVLKKLVSRQAYLYSIGEADFLYLYVNAQGRALARLDEALATELQDLRAASLTYHVVPSLARNGVLVPVIDGFDELLGVLGYEDAFSSLRRFLDDLHGRGRLIASARSTYYQQEFLSRSNRANFAGQDLKIEPIDILPWGDEEFRKYLDFRYQDEKSAKIGFDDFKDDMIRTFKYGENEILRKKPFFVAKVADLVLGSVSVNHTALSRVYEQRDETPPRR